MLPEQLWNNQLLCLVPWKNDSFFSSPGQGPGRAIVLPPALDLVLAAASALAKSLTLKFFM